MRMADVFLIIGPTNFFRRRLFNFHYGNQKSKIAHGDENSHDWSMKNLYCAVIFTVVNPGGEVALYVYHMRLLSTLFSEPRYNSFLLFLFPSVTLVIGLTAR